MHFIPSWSTALAVPRDNFSQRENTEGDGQAGRASWKQPHKCTHGSTNNQRKMVHHRLSVPEGCIQLQVRFSHAAKSPLAAADLASLSATIKRFLQQHAFFRNKMFEGVTCARPLRQYLSTVILETSSLQPAYSMVLLE